jgi:hypothetical protein
MFISYLRSYLRNGMRTIHQSPWTWRIALRPTLRSRNLPMIEMYDRTNPPMRHSKIGVRLLASAIWWVCVVSLTVHIADLTLQVSSNQDIQSSRTDAPSHKPTDTPARPLRAKNEFPGRSRMVVEVKNFLINELGGSSSHHSHR